MANAFSGTFDTELKSRETGNLAAHYGGRYVPAYALFPECFCESDFNLEIFSLIKNLSFYNRLQSKIFFLVTSLIAIRCLTLVPHLND